MKPKETSVLHITNNLEYGGVQKIIYELCEVTHPKFLNVVVASSGGVYVDKLKKLGVEHVHISDISSLNILNIIKNVKLLTRVVDENKINVIHCHHRMAVLYAKLIPRKLTIIYNNHTIYSDKRLFTHLILQNVHVIADGAQAKKNVIDFFGIPSENVVTIDNAVDYFDEKIDPIPEISVMKQNGKFIVMDAARIHPQKGFEYFIGAAQILHRRHEDIAFFIVGDGPLRKKMEALVRKLNLDETITFLGFRDRIKSAIAQADILVLTSVYEGLPLTPMDAFSVKRAVIATNIPGSRDVVTDQVNGLLAESQNSEDIADKIERVYKDRELLTQLSSNAYQTFQKDFSLDRLATSYLDYYARL